MALERMLEALKKITAETHGSGDRREQHINAIASSALDNWASPERKPRAHSLIEVLTEMNETHHIAYCGERGFYEPITNQEAEPFIGKILGWKYAN